MKAWMDPTLLHPIEHGSQETQEDMLQLKLRDSLVRARVALINAVRFTLKSLGYPVSNPSSASFHKLVLNEVPESIAEMIAHNVAAIAELTERIKALDTSISRLAAERYPETIYLQQVSGVGPITSLYFVLKVGNPGRFQRTRDIGAFLGLCPKRDQSGETDKELRISKCGDRVPRRRHSCPSFRRSCESALRVINTSRKPILLPNKGPTVSPTRLTCLKIKGQVRLFSRMAIVAQVLQMVSRSRVALLVLNLQDQ